MTRKILMLLLTIGLMLSSPVRAATGYDDARDYYLGEIISVKVTEEKITIYDYIDNTKREFIVENGVGEDLKAGVEVMVLVEKGTNLAKRVKIIVPRSLKI